MAAHGHGRKRKRGGSNGPLYLSTLSLFCKPPSEPCSSRHQLNQPLAAPRTPLLHSVAASVATSPFGTRYRVPCQVWFHPGGRYLPRPLHTMTVSYGLLPVPAADIVSGLKAGRGQEHSLLPSLVSSRNITLEVTLLEHGTLRFHWIHPSHPCTHTPSLDPPALSFHFYSLLLFPFPRLPSPLSSALLCLIFLFARSPFSTFTTHKSNQTKTNSSLVPTSVRRSRG